MSDASVRRRVQRGVVADNGRVGDSYSFVVLTQKSSAESTSDDDDGANASVTANGAAVGRTTVGGIVGDSGVSVNFNGRRRRPVDTVVTVDVDGRGSSVAAIFS